MKFKAIMVTLLVARCWCPVATSLFASLKPARAFGQLPGSVATDRARLAEILGNPPISADTTLPYLVRPSVRLTWNSKIPFSMNDGALWAGRGMSLSASAGVVVQRQLGNYEVRVALAPELLYSENRPFQLLPGRSPARSAYASPFHGPGPVSSADLPVRFGDRHVLGVVPGRSEVEFASRNVAVGLSAKSQVWGPAVRNPLVLSANAAGIPRFYIRTARPVYAAIGTITAQFFAGIVTESFFFDSIANNDIRSMSGLMVSFQPQFDSGLTIGVTRIVRAPVRSRFRGPLTRAFDVITRWEAIRDSGNRSDQIASLFARWRFPDDGLEIYGEWARQELPRSLKELFVSSYQGAGYTLGLQWAQRKRQREVLRWHAEVTNLEQTRALSGRISPDFYSGRAAPQGHTNRGQVLGAAIGPGGSSQSLGLDYLARWWQVGGFVGRIRWENDAMYREPLPTLFKHDVTLLSGFRGAFRAPGADFEIETTFGHRYNYLFQNGFANYGGYRTIDIRNMSFSLSATPR